jgi:cold shock CspA family protein
MATGTLRWFNVKKNLGFITQDLGGEEVVLDLKFFTWKELDTLIVGARVEYTYIEDIGICVATSARLI